MIARKKKKKGGETTVDGKPARGRLDRPGRRRYGAGGVLPLELPPAPPVWSPVPKDWHPFEDDIIKRAPNIPNPSGTPAGQLDFDKMGHYEQPAFHEWDQRQQIENAPTPKWRASGGAVRGKVRKYGGKAK